MAHEEGMNKGLLPLIEHSTVLPKSNLANQRVQGLIYIDKGRMTPKQLKQTQWCLCGGRMESPIQLAFHLAYTLASPETMKPHAIRAKLHTADRQAH